MNFVRYLILSVVLVLSLAAGTKASASSCGSEATVVSDIITNNTVIFKGRPRYFTNKLKPPMLYSCSTEFIISETIKGDVTGSIRLYHTSRFCEPNYQGGKTYYIIAEKQDNGDLTVGSCGIGYTEFDILELMKNGNLSGSMWPWCRDDIHRAYKSEFLDGEFTLNDKECSRYVPTFKREFPDFVEKHAREK